MPDPQTQPQVIASKAAADGGTADGGTEQSQSTQPDTRPKTLSGSSGYPFLGLPAVPTDLGTLGPYRVTGVLGQGGMGIVFRGEDDGLRRAVALKVMRPEFAAHPIARQRFLREGRAAAGIRCDHVVTIYQVGEHDGLPFLAMEYLGGANLEDWLRERNGRGSPQDAIRLATEVLRGLAAAHETNQIHRDIKPANLWIEEPSGRVKVLDFGLTRSANDAVSLDGAIVGTPSYMAPEQADGLPTDPRADLFALGTVLYRFLTGINPFARESIPATLLAVKTFEPAPLASVVPGVSAEFAAFIHRLLRKNPADRPANAVAAISEFLTPGSQTVIGVVADTLPPAPARLIGREQLLFVTVAQLRTGGLVILKGEGGMGKTSLAAAVAHQLRADKIPVVWVNCEQAARYEGCVREAVFGLFSDRCEAESIEVLAGRVCAQLAACGGLLVFDNFETVASDKSMPRWVTKFGQSARVLITTREVPLGLPGRVIAVHELARTDAVQLFRSLAAGAGLTGEPPSDVVDSLCAHVGDQPLAIELLAVRAARTPVGRLLERVRKGLSVLDAEADPTRPTRHNGVRACFAESFVDLGSTSRQLLLAMSVLPASFGADMIVAITGNDEWDEAAEELVAASLWRLAGERYAVHPLVRQLAREELGEQRAAEQHAAVRITALARTKRSELRVASDRARTKAYLDWCEAELPNLAAVADAARSRGDGPSVIGIAQALSAFWSARGFWDVAECLCSWAVAAAAATRDPAAEAWCTEYRGYICRHIGRFAEADATYRIAVSLCDRHPAADAAYRARISARYGKLCSVLNRHDDAVAFLTVALDRFKRDGDAAGETMSMVYLGQSYKFRGELAQAEKLFLLAIERARLARDTHRECEALYQLGNTYLRMNRPADAERVLQESLRMSRLADDRVRESQNLVDLGVAATLRQSWPEAERNLMAGLNLAHQLGLRLHEGRTMRRLAELFVTTGELERAYEFARGAVRILAESEDEWAKTRSSETLRAIEEAIAKKAANP